MAKLRNFDWRQQAAFLIRVRKNPDLPDQASSFSDWLRQKAEREGIQVSTLWRYLNAASYAIDNPIGPWQTVTQAEQIPAGISAEALELAEKIGRVAPQQVMAELLADVYHKKLRRMDLLKIWQNYRDALPNDTTARGRGAKRPVVDKNRPEHQAVVLKIDALNRLQQTAPECLGYSVGTQLRVVKTESVCSAVLVVHDKQQGVLAVDPVVMAWDTFCDVVSARDDLSWQRAWLITFSETIVSDSTDTQYQPASSSPRMPSDWPPSWGLMQLSATALTVIKQPSSPAQPIPLAARLALQALL